MESGELEERIEAQRQRLLARKEPECATSPDGKHDTSGNKYVRANNHVCRYCLKIVS